jgi:hypothetical protein
MKGKLDATLTLLGQNKSARRIDVARSWALARQQFAAITEERDALKFELALTKQSLDEMRAALTELRIAVLERQRAEDALAELYREREIQRAQRAERDPVVPLQ